MGDKQVSVTTPKAGDYTGRLRAEQQKESAKELSDRKDEIALAAQIEREAIEHETHDLTREAILARQASIEVDGVEDLTETIGEDPNLYREIRLAEDVEDATIASHEGINTYSFKQGHKYRVPKNVADVLQERGLIYDRA